MDEPEPAHDHQTLNALNEQIAAEQARIADLQHRIRVIDVELASWKKLPPAKNAVSPRAVNAGGLAFFLGFVGCSLLGRLIAVVIGR